MHLPLLGTLLWLLVTAQGEALPPQSTASDARQVHWQRSLEDALEIARLEDRPLLLAVNMDGESASDRIVNEEYRDPAFVAASREFVCLVSSVFRHTPRDHDDRGRRIPCPRLGEVTCGEHVALEPVLFERFLSDGERVAPRHAVVLQDGTKTWDLSLSFDLLDIDRALVASANRETERRRAAELAERPPLGDSWAALADTRRSRGRARLEEALEATHDARSLIAALDAIGLHGDAGSLDALRIVAARIPQQTDEVRARLVETARGLDLAAPLAAAVRDHIAAPYIPPGSPGGASRSAFLPVLAELDGASAATRSLLLACRALSEYGAPAERAVGIALGAEGAVAVDEAVAAGGGTLSVRELLRTAEATTRGAGDAGEAAAPESLRPAEELEVELAELDDALASDENAVATRARFAKACLDLARRRLEAGGSAVLDLLEDAERNFAFALEAEPSNIDGWLDRARTAYLLQRFDVEVEYGRRAHALLSDAGATLEDPRVRDARRWIGDGSARLLAERSGADPVAEIGGILEGARALGSVAASAYGDSTDWTSFATFLGALGLHAEEAAIALRGAERLPEHGDVRGALNTSIWSTGRIDLASALAESVGARNPASALTHYYSGYAWILTAEDLRRRESFPTAIADYARAQAHFDAAVEMAPDWGANGAHFAAITWLGRGLAHVRLGDRAAAADSFVAAAATGAALVDIRDGLGYDVYDLCDKIFEWRATGPSDVDPLALLDRLDAVGPGNPLWATAISDSQLREALRADGRNPERAERDSVDASGNRIRQMMGLPWEEGDGYLEASILAARRALALAQTESESKPLAQSCTIRAERQLELGRLDGVHAALAEAAPLMNVAAPAPEADEATLRALARELRDLLGEARPRWRLGR